MNTNIQESKIIIENIVRMNINNILTKHVLEEYGDNLAILLQSNHSEYDASWCAEDGSCKEIDQLEQTIKEAANNITKAYIKVLFANAKE